MTFWRWSKTAANNGTADPSINYAEGMAASGLNDSGRAVMAAAAKFRDDTSGALISTGTSTAYILASNQGFTSKAAMNGAEITFTINATNDANPTLNVDGLGGDPLIIDTFGGLTPVPSATLVAGGVYSAVYYNSGNNWRLKDFYQIPFTVPIGGMVDFIGSSVPSSNFVFPIGQSISRTTYATLFGLVGTTYGTGDGSTTFNVPDLTGRVVAMKEASAARLTSSYFGGNSTNLGATGGLESHTLSTGEMPTHNHGVTDPTHTHSTTTPLWGNPATGSSSQGGTTFNMLASTIVAAATGISIQSAGSGNAHAIVQPTIILNKLLRII